VTCSGTLTDSKHDEARAGRYSVTFSNRMQDKKAHPGLLSKECVFQVAEACARVVSAPSSRTKHVACAELLRGAGTTRLLYLQLHSLPGSQPGCLSVTSCADTLPFTIDLLTLLSIHNAKSTAVVCAGLAAHTKPLRESGPGASPSRPFAIP